MDVSFSRITIISGKAIISLMNIIIIIIIIGIKTEKKNNDFFYEELQLWKLIEFKNIYSRLLYLDICQHYIGLK